MNKYPDLVSVEERVEAEQRERGGNGDRGAPLPSGPGDYGFDAGPVPQDVVPPTPELEFFDAGDEDGKIPPREWLLGTTFCRGYLSGLISAGAGGKTTMRIAELLSSAIARALTGEHVFVRARAMIVCLEDDLKELRRRVLAARIHHRIPAADVKGWLILTTPRRLKIAELDGKGRVVEGAMLRALVKAIDDLKLDLVCIDPAIKAHAVNENDNAQIDAFASMLADLAVEKNISVDLLSHERKPAFANANAGDVNRGRGAGAQKDASRLIKTITSMSEAEAAALGVNEADRAFLIRLDNAKVNIAPPSREAAWFRLVGVNLDNGTEAYPNGDNVQTVERWTPPGQFEGFSTADLNTALDRLRAGMGDGRLYSVAPSAKARAAWRALQEICPAQNEQRCRGIIATWVKNGVLTIGEYYDTKERKELDGVTGARTVGGEVES